VTGDQAYSSRANRQALRGKPIRTTIPEPNDQIANRKRRGSRGGRPPEFDPVDYRRRNQVERGFNRREHWRGPATRFDKLGVNYQATLDLVEMLDWLRAVPDGHDPRDNLAGSHLHGTRVGPIGAEKVVQRREDVVLADSLQRRVGPDRREQLGVGPDEHEAGIAGPAVLD
jgi:transposase